METGRLNSDISRKQSNKKCLWFDRRYGWVYEVWIDPSEEALSGGRGMFCIVPLTKNFIACASHAINHITASTLQVLEKPDLFTPEVLKSNLNCQVQRIASCMKKTQFDLPSLMRSPKFASAPHEERNELQNVQQ